MAAHVRTLLRWLLGALILATGIGKALDVGGFAGVLADYRLGLDDDALSILALMVCALEIGLGDCVARPPRQWHSTPHTAC